MPICAAMEAWSRVMGNSIVRGSCLTARWPAACSIKRSTLPFSTSMIPSGSRSSERWPASAVSTTTSPPGVSTRANSSALRGAKITVSTSTEESRSGRRDQASATTAPTRGWHLARWRAAGTETSRPTPRAPTTVSSVCAR